jgi:predicted outer membrane repeat protein
MVGQGEEMEACARGGGVFKQPGSMVVANCNFLENRAWHQDEVWKEYEEPEQLVLCSRDDCGSGGAIYDAGGSLTVENCLFQNTYSVRGGAIYSMGYLQISDSVFETNTAFGQWNQYDPCDKEPRADWRQDAYDHTEFGYGGEICNSGSLEIRRCSFHGNVSVNGGVLKAGKIDVRDSEFVDNRAYGVYKEYDTITDEYGNGGAVEQNDLDGQLAAANCVFSQNTAKTGGAISACNAAVFNSVFYQNSAVSELDPLPDDVEPGSCSAIFLAGDPATVYVKNSIFQEGIADDDKVVSDNVDVSYSRIDTDYEGEGNVDADALFTDPQNGDFHLQTGSPCIDSADGTAAPELDKDGNPRYDAPLTPNTGIGPPWADMGAYEWFE